LLLLVVLAPSVVLLWFMNQAVKNERLAVRQKLVDAYREHLVVAQQRLEEYWKQQADKLDGESDRVSPPELFANEVRDGRADAVVCYDGNGTVVYPSVAHQAEEARAITGGEWQAAAKLEASDSAGAAAAFANFEEH